MMMRRGYLLLLVLLLASCGQGTVAKPPTTTASSAAVVLPTLTPSSAPASTALPSFSTAIPSTAAPISVPPTSTPLLKAPAPTSIPPTPAPTTGGCSLGVVENLSGESSSADEAKTASWTLQHENNWTVFTPGGDWHLSTSSQGLDVLAPEGGSDASLASWPSTTPWTYESLAANILSAVSNIQVICQSPNETSSSGQTQATEITGVYQGANIHAIIVLSLLAPTTPGFFDGQTRSIYTPVSQWSTESETTLWLIIKRAILNPSGP